VERLNGLLEDIKGRLKVHEKQAQEPTGADAGNIHLAIRSVKELQLEIEILNMVIDYFTKMSKR
jgi:hypothetical protein